MKVTHPRVIAGSSAWGLWDGANRRRTFLKHWILNPWPCCSVARTEWRGSTLPSAQGPHKYGGANETLAASRSRVFETTFPKSNSCNTHILL